MKLSELKQLIKEEIQKVLSEALIKWNGKDYQKGKSWVVYKTDNGINLGIKVNDSAGWDADDYSNFKLMDAGKQRAAITFKEGNIQSFANKMFELNSKTSDGETEGLTPKDYADIIKVWIDMKKLTK